MVENEFLIDKGILNELKCLKEALTTNGYSKSDISGVTGVIAAHKCKRAYETGNSQAICTIVDIQEGSSFKATGGFVRFRCKINNLNRVLKLECESSSRVIISKEVNSDECAVIKYDSTNYVKNHSILLDFLEPEVIYIFSVLGEAESGFEIEGSVLVEADNVTEGEQNLYDDIFQEALEFIKLQKSPIDFFNYSFGTNYEQKDIDEMFEQICLKEEIDMNDIMSILRGEQDA